MRSSDVETETAELIDARHEIVETTIAIERLTGRTIEELMSNE